MDSIAWHFVCLPEEIEKEDVMGFELEGNCYAVYRTKSGYYASEGLCPHERSRLSDGLVIGEYIECPKHNSRFYIPTGKVRRVPAKRDLKTYPVKIDKGKLYIGISKE
jgi:3-phenylpropionate/trans-cinnamate dioxygenase ferredoxin subunit